MGKRVKLPEGQQCECIQEPAGFHDFFRQGREDEPFECCNGAHAPVEHIWPDHGGQLKRIYWKNDGRMCYAWWCANCRSWLDEYEDEAEPWPTGRDGRFVPSVHCQIIPGLD